MAVMKNQKTGMWEVRTYYKDWTGTRRQKTKRGFAKKSEAQEWERAFKLKMPMAAMLPNKVDAVAASSAMVMVLIRAFIRE